MPNLDTTSSTIQRTQIEAILNLPPGQLVSQLYESAQSVGRVALRRHVRQPDHILPTGPITGAKPASVSFTHKLDVFWGIVRSILFSRRGFERPRVVRTSQGEGLTVKEAGQKKRFAIWRVSRGIPAETGRTSSTHFRTCLRHESEADCVSDDLFSRIGRTSIASSHLSCRLKASGEAPAASLSAPRKCASNRAGL